MKKFPILAFNITNVCNFNCPECYTLSNYNFTGHQLWKDYEEIYKKWSCRISAPEWEILGGEPTLNPSFLEWVSGINNLWPNSRGIITTNGSNGKIFNQDFYNILCKIKPGITIRIQLHNKTRRESVLTIIKKWLKEPISINRYNDIIDVNKFNETWLNSYANIKAEHWPECKEINDWNNLSAEIQNECTTQFNLQSPFKLIDEVWGFKLLDKNKIEIIIQNADEFTPGPLIPSNDQISFRFHNSDPVKAHEICSSKYCTTFIQGKIYKCHQVGHFAEFEKQFNVVFDDEKDRKLIHSYEPASLDHSNEALLDFYNKLKNPIPQCKFCSESIKTVSIKADTKKIKFVKRK